MPLSAAHSACPFGQQPEERISENVQIRPYIGCKIRTSSNRRRSRVTSASNADSCLGRFAGGGLGASETGLTLVRAALEGLAGGTTSSAGSPLSTCMASDGGGELALAFPLAFALPLAWGAGLVAGLAAATGSFPFPFAAAVSLRAAFFPSSSEDRTTTSIDLEVSPLLLSCPALLPFLLAAAAGLEGPAFA